MALGTYSAPVNTGKASTFDPRPQFGNVGKPLIVVLREFKAGFVTPKYPNPKDVVICDVVDLSPTYAGGEAVVLPSVIWGAAAITDQINKQCQPGVAYPMKIVTVIGNSGTPYAKIQGLQEDPADAEMLQRAVAWDGQFGLAYIDHMAAQKRAADAMAAAAAPVAPAAPAQPAWTQQAAAPAAWQRQPTQPAAPAAWQPQTAAPVVQQPAAAAWTPQAAAPVTSAAPAAAWQAPTTAAELDAAIGDLGGS